MHHLKILYIIGVALMFAYICFLAGRTLPDPADADTNPVNQRRRRIRSAAAVLITQWGLTFLVYLPHYMFFDGAPEGWFSLCIIDWIVIVSTGYCSVWAMNAFLQVRHNTRRTMPWCMVLEAGVLLWFIIVPSELPHIIMFAILAVGYMVYAVYYYQAYRRYTRSLLMEFSDITEHSVRWVWIAWGALLVQGILFIINVATPYVIVDWVDALMLLITATFVSRSVMMMTPIQEALIEESESVDEGWSGIVADTPPDKAIATRQRVHEKIREQLAQCEAQQLYLDPNLTREMLCTAIGVNRTYLTEFLRGQGTTYYGYINTLRIRHAVALMAADSTLSLAEVCYSSGFSTSATFRNAFKEVMGCLPSQYTPPPAAAPAESTEAAE